MMKIWLFQLMIEILQKILNFIFKDRKMLNNYIPKYFIRNCVVSMNDAISGIDNSSCISKIDRVAFGYYSAHSLTNDFDFVRRPF